MKIIYCIHSIYNPGGMERVLLNKVSYLVSKLNYDIEIITTDQKKRPPFYPFPSSVTITDLGINYSDDNEKNIFIKTVGYLKRRRKHKKLLTNLLLEKKADIVISLFPSESSFIPSIKDGSKKILELHFCKYFRMQYGRKGIIGLIDKIRTKQDEKLVRKFDKFVVLSNEDSEYWGDVGNIEIIPNAAMVVTSSLSTVENKRVIAVGRLDYQKGFDRLLKSWAIVRQNKLFNDWRLDIYGQGEWDAYLKNIISSYNLIDSVSINAPIKDIYTEYKNSALLVMSSNYEGFPMVMIEAMSCGIPVVSFDFKCGPKDIITDGYNGLLVKNGDINGLADAIIRVMSDEDFRKKLSLNAVNIVNTYSEDVIMKKWIDVFNELVKR